MSYSESKLTENKIGLYILCFLMFILATIYLIKWTNDNPLIAEKDFLQIKNLTVQTIPQFFKRRKFKGGEEQWIEFYINQYKNKFKISGLYYECLDIENFKHKIKEGDTIEIKILNKYPWNKFDETNTKEVELTGIKVRGIELIDVGCRNSTYKSRNKSAFIFFLIAGIIAGCYIFYILRKRKIKS